MNRPEEPQAALARNLGLEARETFLTNLHWLFLILAAINAVLCVTWPYISPATADYDHWPDILFLLVSCACLSLGLARQLPLANVMAAVFITLIFGAGLLLVGAQTGVPFGPFHFNVNLEPKLMDLMPPVAPLVWVTVIFSARGVIRLVLRPWRKTNSYGFWLIGLTATLTVLTDLAMDPFATHARHYWNWLPTKVPFTWYGATFVNFLSWGCVATLILAFITPLLINKQLSRKNVADYHPLVIWVAVMIIVTAGAAEAKLWPAVILDGVIFLVPIAMAIRGARW